MIFILIGHRASGKSTIGKLAAVQLGVPFFDLDIAIHKGTGKTPAQLIRADEKRFREIERETLRTLLSQGIDGVIALGGGFQLQGLNGVSPMPQQNRIIWLYNEEWQERAGRSRARLRQDLLWKDELAWMIEQREPQYSRYAHTQVYIERGCRREEAGERLARAMQLLSQVRAPRACLVPDGTGQLEQATDDCKRFGFAGIELRSDFIPEPPKIDVPFIASLRTEDAEFFSRMEGAAAFDCDVRFVGSISLPEYGRPFILSSHPHATGEQNVAEFERAFDVINERSPSYASHIEFKYAPAVHSWDELRTAFSIAETLTSRFPSCPVTFIPQGKRWWWVRAFLIGKNARQYLTYPGTALEGSTPILGDMLPHMAGPLPTKWFALIGKPVDGSVGDIFHRTQSLRYDEGSVGYLKIEVAKEDADTALAFLHELGFAGLSVTAPLKQAVAESHHVNNEQQLPAGNTLLRTERGWTLYDTDAAGMKAALALLEQHGFPKGRAAIYGQGGVSPAVRRAIEESGWQIDAAVRAREGWHVCGCASTDLIVNASGTNEDSRDGAPPAKAWIDLHYRNLIPPPAGVSFYMSGMPFFEAQANEQRRLWGLNTEQTE